MTRRSLLDVNVLIALTEPGHAHYPRAQEWFNTRGKGVWGICSLTEAGFLRVTTNPMFRPIPRTLEQATAVLQVLKGHSDFGFWEIRESWVTLTASFGARLTGHQQITDAYLLGLAIKEDGVLVTFDKGIKYMAGAEFSRNILILE